MKKRMLSMLLACVMLIMLIPCNIAGAEENVAITSDVAAAYKTVLENYISAYGGYSAEEVGLASLGEVSKPGVGYVQFIDFDQNGVSELLIVYHKKITYGEWVMYEPFYDIYGYNGKTAECLYSATCVNSMGGFISLSLIKMNGKIYTCYDGDMWADGGRTQLGTITNGVWEMTVFEDYAGGFDDETGVYTYTINGQALSEVDYMNQLRAIWKMPSQRVDYDAKYSAQNAIDTLNAVVGATQPGQIDPYVAIRRAYIGKLGEVHQELFADNSGYTLNTAEYYVYDVNKDVIPELIIKRGTCEADYRFDVFTYAENQVMYAGKIQGGHISLVSVPESGILLYFAHMGYERMYEGFLNNNKISYALAFEDDCTQKAYNYDGNLDTYREGARYLRGCENLQDYTLLNSYFDDLVKWMNTVKVKVNGKEIVFDQPPVIVNDRTLVPLRVIFEELGATVEWDGITKTVTATKGETVVKLTIGQAAIYKNGKSIALDVPAQLVNDRTLVPARAVAECLDCLVDWNGETKTVIVKTRECAVMEFAKNLCNANESMGGLKLFASYVEADTLLYTTLMDIMVALEYQDVVLDVVSMTTAIGTNVVMASHGDFSGATSTVGEVLGSIYQNINIADVLDASGKDLIKSHVFNQIESNVPDATSFVLNLGTTAYYRNEQMVPPMRELHGKILQGDYNYADAVAYITVLETSVLNRKTMAMAVQVLSDELPANFLESLGKTTGTSILSLIKTYLGNKISGRGINVGLEIYTDLVSAYAEYAGGEMKSFIEVLNKMDHPAFKEWANAIEVYNENMKKYLFIQ